MLDVRPRSAFILAMALTPNALLTDLLRDVSRSFYLTLRVLPKSIRPQIGLAYLLARTTDTIADTDLVPLDQRLNALAALRDRILGRSSAPLNFGDLAGRQNSPAERILLEQCDASLDLLESMSATDQHHVRQVLEIITSGQELDLRRFAGASMKQIVSLKSDSELDDYTYRVAGCVGEFWTRICRDHLFPRARVDEIRLLSDGLRFGKGLQLVNILRDIPKDLRQGRCYLPEPRLAEVGLTPADLLNPEIEPKFRALYDDYLSRAKFHLAAGWAYTNALPWRCVRVRLACAWPILIGVKTLELLRSRNVLDPTQRIKIDRQKVRNLLFRSVLCYPLPATWRKLVSMPDQPR